MTSASLEAVGFAVVLGGIAIAALVALVASPTEAPAPAVDRGRDAPPLAG
ncbi:MAG: hypothetical protein ACXVII_46200 [Solirubrobacteraceae bacterium]